MQRSPKTIWLAVLAFLFFVSPLMGQATAPQDSSTPAKDNPPVDVAKAQPSSPDTPPQRVAPVKTDSFVIGAEDLLTINVWKEQELSRQVPVRPDGMISLPLLGDVKAAGLTPLQLQDLLTADLKKYISDPQVTVIVTQVNSLSFNVVGEVLKPGYYPLTRRMTVLDAIAMAGGFRDFAKIKKIYVLRTAADGKEVRLPFNYKNVVKGKNMSQNIELEPRDTLVVP
ncbi:MAG: polysaccharide biosynthesis/export family protein [Candidatus Korobacteraceae bacterium]